MGRLGEYTVSSVDGQVLTTVDIAGKWARGADPPRKTNRPGGGASVRAASRPLSGGVQLAVQVALVGGVPVPWKPNSVLAPAEIWPLYDMLAKRIVPVLPLGCAFHVLVTVEPPGRVADTDQ